MRLFVRGLSAALLLLVCALVARGQPFTPTKTATHPSGVHATVDLPTSQHLRNTGGSDGPRGPGSGSGLCVFTAVEMSANWGNLPQLRGFQTFMTKRPGGG